MSFSGKIAIIIKIIVCVISFYLYSYKVLRLNDDINEFGICGFPMT